MIAICKIEERFIIAVFIPFLYGPVTLLALCSVKSGLKPYSFHFIFMFVNVRYVRQKFVLSFIFSEYVRYSSVLDQVYSPCL